jgi:hypothetical protein
LKFDGIFTWTSVLEDVVSSVAAGVDFALPDPGIPTTPIPDFDSAPFVAAPCVAVGVVAGVPTVLPGRPLDFTPGGDVMAASAAAFCDGVFGVIDPRSIPVDGVCASAADAQPAAAASNSGRRMDMAFMGDLQISNRKP